MKSRDFKARYEAQGNDKINTLTHCRFEAKALFNTDNVLVVDFDEFLYCNGAHDVLSAASQMEYVMNVMRQQKQDGRQQISIPQRVTTTKTGTLISLKLTCIINADIARTPS